MNPVNEYQKDNTEYECPKQLIVALTHKDVNLAFFKDKQPLIRQLLSGQKLDISGDYLLYKNYKVAKFSKAFLERLLEYQNLGYVAKTAKIRFVLSWFCKDDEKEYDIILPSINLELQQSED